ncbi:hypothetical protein SAMN05428939_0331 [Streptomyces sp. TLI_105]|nr:hypothetical protein SAMN05428939_0331 [Streptomyces sp. TLI_105]
MTRPLRTRKHLAPPALRLQVGDLESKCVGEHRIAGLFLGGEPQRVRDPGGFRAQIVKSASCPGATRPPVPACPAERGPGHGTKGRLWAVSQKWILSCE